MKYRAKRATQRWLEGAPAYVLCCFDHPDVADRYTIVFGGKYQQGGDTFASAWFHCLGTSESGHYSGGFEFKAHELASYRYANSHRKIRWRDLPLAVRLRARYFAEDDGNLPHSEIVRIGAEEKGIEERIAANA